MKKQTLNRITALLLALVLCLSLTACQNGGREENSSPRTMAEAQQEKAQASAAAQEKENEDKDILRVVTDIDWRSVLYGKGSGASQGKKAFQTILDHFGGIPSGIEAELNVLPTDQGGAYDSELTRLRTEIAAGAGPDVFLMSGFGGPFVELPENTLFQSPEAAMEKGFFLPLDEYMENAQFMEFDKLDQKVMEVGRNEQGQVILPMFYRLHQACVFRAMEPEAIPGDWEAAAATEDEYLLEALMLALNSSGFRQMVFGQIADYETEELLLDQETFRQRVSEAVEAYRRGLPHMRALNEMSYEEMARSIYAQVDDWTNNVTIGRGEYTSFVFRNEEGEINAPIETWCAVNANTKHPEDAFFIVDCLMSREFLSQELFWIKAESGRFNHDQMTFFWAAGEDSIPVYTALPGRGKDRYKYTEALTDEQQKALARAREETGCVYFTSNVDREIDRTMARLLQRIYDGEEVTDEEVRREADRCYTTMKMMLAES